MKIYKATNIKLTEGECYNGYIFDFYEKGPYEVLKEKFNLEEIYHETHKPKLEDHGYHFYTILAASINEVSPYDVPMYELTAGDVMDITRYILREEKIKESVPEDVVYKDSQISNGTKICPNCGKIMVLEESHHIRGKHQKRKYKCESCEYWMYNVL